MSRDVCFWCRQELRDGREESGYTGEGPDWCTLDGDFGCDAEGCGDHLSRSEARRILTERMARPTPPEKRS